jgi:hypothetical protein
MHRFLTLGTLLLALALVGCGPSEESKPVPAAPETAAEKAADAVKNAAGEVKEAAQVVADKATEIEKQAEPAVKEAVEESKVMASQVTAAAKETVTEARQATAQAVDTAAGQAVSPEMIVLEASYGNVTFPHAVHAAAYACTTCHGAGTPGLFGLDKDKAHALCKDCHKQEGAGPTACTGCHKK